MPTSIEVGLYYYDTDVLQQSVTLTSPVITNLSFGDSCYTPTGLCVDEGVFTSSTITIPGHAAGYYLHTQLYARNAGVGNLSAPASTALTFYSEMPDPSIGPNSSPVFQQYPATSYFCTGFNRLFSLPFYDPDGDSLSYRLVAPLAGATAAPSANGTYPKPYPDVIWETGYSLANIVSGTPAMSVHPTNGIINAAPSTIGKFVFALQVSEWRAGVKIGETTVDLQYEAVSCTTCFLVSGTSTDASCPTCGDGSIDITVDTAAVPPYTFYWSTGDTTEDISGLNQGSYYVTVEDATGSFSSQSFYVGGSTGLDEEASGIKVFPNPADNLLYIVFNTSNSGFKSSDLSVNIIDQMGRLIGSHNTSSGNQLVIDTSQFPEGVYYIRVTDGVSVSSKKFIVLDYK